MTADETYTSDGPHNVDDPESVQAIIRADQATDEANRRRAEKRSKPGFFVAPDDYLPEP